MSKDLQINIKRKEFLDEPRVLVLNNLKFKQNAGEFLCILGPSGCGKSTLLRLIMGLDLKYEGEIYIANKPIKGVSTDCGIVFQESRLLPWLSVKDNIEFGLHNNGNLIKKKIINTSNLLELFQLKEFAKSYPYQLSGGMAQRVALARAFVNLPDLLLMDEPFGSLDKLTKIRLQEELIKVLQKEKTTTLMVTHDIEEAVFLADRILIMQNRPSKIVKEYKINLKKPRDRTDEEFLIIVSKILKEMKENLKLF